MTQKKLTFEQALEKLEQIVSRLESGEISLDKSIDAFEEGQQLVQFCLKKLNEAEKKVKKLTRDSEGNFNLSEF
ncbi:MAG: exodeoxyribonuclease VII small subunit [Calditrichaeota bacterium]|nr:exodeoxyribonuclease VII small subunit [Calditrichota bacterium]